MVEVLRPGDEWTLVRMANSTRDMWCRYLVSQQPASFSRPVAGKNKALSSQAAGLVEETTA
jgi:hypothetical protein